MNEQRMRIIEKVQKLFALSNRNDSPEEAQAAAAVARELLKKYDLNLSEVEIKEKGSSLCAEHRIKQKGLNLHIWVKILLGAVSRGFSVKGMTAKGNRTAGIYPVLVLIGVEPDVTIAGQTFEYLHHFATTYDLRGKNTKENNDWRRGFACAIDKRFQEQKKQDARTARSHSLVLAKDAVIQDFLASKGYITRKGRRGPRLNTESESFYDGVRVGMNTPINRPVDESCAKHVIN
jgi:hypothetical protein